MQKKRFNIWEMIVFTLFPPPLPFVQVGLYQESVVSYEVVLADGSAVTATRDNEYSDLFHCLPWSHGTLGKLIMDTPTPKKVGKCLLKTCQKKMHLFKSINFQILFFF